MYHVVVIRIVLQAIEECLYAVREQINLQRE